jgi:glycosyltransferase involved in cell wall biosynthesis
MKILHVVPSYFPAVRYGGPIHSVHGLCKALAARGHEVHVFTTNVDGPEDSDVPLGAAVDMDGIKVWYFPVPALRRLYWSPAMAKALRERVGGFDIVHLHSVFLWPTWAAARAARQRNVPYVLAPRGMLVRELIRRKSSLVKRAWISLVERGNIGNAALVHFTSRTEAEEASALGLAIRKSCIVANGLEMPGTGEERRYSLPRNMRDGPFLLFLGRINWKKGLDRLIAAMRGVPDCRLVIAGNDEEGLQAKLEALAAASGVRERVLFVGPVHGEDKAALLQRALLLVLPSYSENFGNVVLESMAAGRPVVVTPEVGAADMVRESGAGAVLEGDPAILGAGLRHLVSDRAALDRMGAQGREFVRHQYSWDTVARQMEEAYRQVIGK